MKRFLYLLPLLLLSALPARAQLANARGWCEDGAQVVVTSGLSSSTTVQASYPSCTISVSVHGGGAATIFSDGASTPLSNPFTSQTNGQWIFYAANGEYDITMTGGGLPSPVTYSDVFINGGSGGGGGGGTPSAPVNSVQYNCAGVFCGAAGIITPDGDSLQIKGPNPWVDVNSFGARPVGAVPSTTASCAGTTAITLAADPGFVNGDGIVIYGCGATNTLSTPGVPTATTGIASTLTVPDAKLVAPSAAGASTYQYKIFGIDRHGGTTVAGAAVTLGTGPAALGMSGPITVTSASLSGTTLTLTLPATNLLAAGMLIHFSKSTNALLSGYYSISSVGGGGTSIVIINTEIESTGTAITSTGGNIAFATGNQLTWTPVANTWEYGICAKRPGDGAYSLIGLALPSLTRSYTSNTTFTDWGATLTSAPMLPAYLTSANCAAGAATNDYLSTTIVSGAGTISIVVAVAATQTTSGQTAKFDDAPGFLAAAQSVGSIAGGIVFIPPDPNGGSYYINSRLDLVSLGPGLSVNQEGLVFAYETIAFRAHWYGTQSALSVNQFQAASAPVIGCNGAWPCFYDPDEVPFVDHLTFGVPNSNSSLVMLFDGQAGPLQGGTISRITCSSGTTLDYSGMCIVVRPGPYNFIMQDMSTLSGPSNLTTFIDSTWTPSIYFVGDTTASPFSAINYHLRDIQMSGRTMYMATVPGTTGQNDEISHLYAQGPIIPMVTLQNPISSVPGINMRITDWTTDTSPVSSIVVLGPLAVVLDAMDIGVPSAEAGGVPGWVSGRNLFGGFFSSTPPLTSGAYVGISGVDLTGTYASTYRCPEQAAPIGIAGFDIFWCDSTHVPKVNPNNVGAQTLARTSATLTDLDCTSWSGTIGLLDDLGGKCARYTISPTNTDCVNWSGTGGLLGDVAGQCATYSVVPVVGNCTQWAAGPKLGDSGSPCGAGGGGMNTDMSNMANPTAMNRTLTPAAANTIAIGTALLPFTQLFLGTVANQAGSFDTSALTANRSMKIPNAASTLVQDCPTVTNKFLTQILQSTGVCTVSNISASATMPFAYAADSGSSTAYVVTLSPVATSYVAGLEVDFLPANANTSTNPTLNVNALGAATITKFGTVALSLNDLITTAVAKVIYDGTRWQLQNPATFQTALTASSSNTLTNKPYNAEGTGNALSEPVRYFIPAGGCNNATAGNGWDIGVTVGPTPQCAGSTVRKGILQFARGNVAYINLHLPKDWNSSASTDINVCFTTTDTTNGHVTSFNIQTGFNKIDGTATDDPSLNALQALSVTTGASQISGGQLCGSLTAMTMTGSNPDYNFEIAITRNNSGTDTNTDTAVGVKSAEVIIGVTKNATNR